MVLPWFSRYTRHPNSSNAVAQADDFSQDSRCRASGSFGGKDTLQSKMAGNPPNYMVHDPQTAVVNSAFWHLKKVSGVVAPYWYFRCENQGFGISQNYFFCTTSAGHWPYFLPWFQRTCLAALPNLARKTLGWHGPRSFCHMNCWN